MALRDYLEKLGYTDKEYDIFVMLYQYGPKPISTIAAHIKCDRTYCYKLVSHMTQDGLLAETTIKWVKHAYVSDREVLVRLLENKRRELDRLENDFTSIEQELRSYDLQAQEHLPQMMVYDKSNALEEVYADLKKNIEINGLIAIKFFVSSTFSDQVSASKEFAHHHDAFIARAWNRNLLIDAYLAQGILTMDHILHTQDRTKLSPVAPGIWTTHGYLCGSTLYMIQFKEFPTAFKLTSFDMADLLHFVFEQIGK